MVQRVWNNKEFTLTTAGDEVTIHKTTGTDSATDKYLNFSTTNNQEAVIMKSISIIPDKEALLISINGENADNPMTLVAKKGLSKRASGFIGVWNYFKIRAVDDTTDVKVIVFI